MPAAELYRTWNHYSSTRQSYQRLITGLMNGGRSCPFLIKSNLRVGPGRRCTALCPLLAQSGHMEARVRMSAFRAKRTSPGCRWSLDGSRMTQSGHRRGQNSAAQQPCRTLSVLVVRLPAGGAFGNEIEEVPDAAEIVARRERRVGHPHDSPFLAPEHGDARHPAAVLTVAHVLGERGAFV